MEEIEKARKTFQEENEREKSIDSSYWRLGGSLRLKLFYIK